MQLNITTDYAIRSLLYLATQKGFVASVDIAQAMSIPPNYQIGIMTKLRKAGFVTSTRGNTGGYTLAKSPEEISLLDIVTVMEGTVHINRCLGEGGYCSRFATRDCPIRSFYRSLQSGVEQALCRVTLQSMLVQLAATQEAASGWMNGTV